VAKGVGLAAFPLGARITDDRLAAPAASGLDTLLPAG
jgi:hypothetical protein